MQDGKTGTRRFSYTKIEGGKTMQGKEGKSRVLEFELVDKELEQKRQERSKKQMAERLLRIQQEARKILCKNQG